MKLHARLIAATMLALVAGLSTGCDDDDPDHRPPAGQGTIYIDNNSSDTLRVFFDGEAQQDVRGWKERAYDLNPGVYRVVLIEKSDGDRSFRADIDVLEGRLTILDVSLGTPSRYQVFLQFD